MTETYFMSFFNVGAVRHGQPGRLFAINFGEKIVPAIHCSIKAMYFYFKEVLTPIFMVFTMILYSLLFFYPQEYPG